jgi:predicted nucleic acid-binding protein
LKLFIDTWGWLTLRDGRESAIAEGYVALDLITSAQFDQAIALRLKFKDKPRISFTDLLSMVVMRERGVTHILTEDDHFAQVGMGFLKVP